MSDAPFDLDDSQAQAYCPECGAAYVTADVLCTECRTRLITRAEAQAIWDRRTLPDPDTPTVLVATAPDELAAAAYRSAFEDAGILYFTQSMPAAFGRFLGLDGEVRFFVELTDQARAEAALEGVRRDETESDDDAPGA